MLTVMVFVTTSTTVWALMTTVEYVTVLVLFTSVAVQIFQKALVIVTVT